MAQITVKTTGVSRGATPTWDQKLIPLDMGGGEVAAAFQSSPGTFVYAIVARFSCPMQLRLKHVFFNLH
jgi:hypothetical protein